MSSRAVASCCMYQYNHAGHHARRDIYHVVVDVIVYPASRDMPPPPPGDFGESCLGTGPTQPPSTHGGHPEVSDSCSADCMYSSVIVVVNRVKSTLPIVICFIDVRLGKISKLQQPTRLMWNLLYSPFRSGIPAYTTMQIMRATIHQDIHHVVVDVPTCTPSG